MSFSFFDQLIIRTPSFPLKTSFLSREALVELCFSSPTYLEAIFLASPSLHRELLDYREGKAITKKDEDKIIDALNKYMIRMHSRAVPFGLFSGVGTLLWGEKTTVKIKDSYPQKSIRLDMTILDELINILLGDKSIRKGIRFYPNSSIYSLNQCIRYVEFTIENGKRKYTVAEVHCSDSVLDVLKITQHGKSFIEIVQFLSNQYECSVEEGEEYLNTLISSQLIVSELTPSLSGKPVLDTIIEVLSQTKESESNIKKVLLEVKKNLSIIENNCNCFEQYDTIRLKLNEINVGKKSENLFQVDSYIKFDKGSIDKNIQKDLIQSIRLLNAVNNEVAHPNMDKFTEQFIEMYDGQEVSLTEVMDTEIGIGYPIGSNISKDENPLLNGIGIYQNFNESNQLPWSPFLKFLSNKIIKLLRDSQNGQEIVLKEEEILLYDNGQGFPFSDTFFSFFKLYESIDERKGYTVYPINFSGSSGVNLISRFSEGNSQIEQLCKEVGKYEQSIMENDAILCELIHIPESRNVNIIKHTSFRDYEIPLLANSSKPEEQQIRIDDLVLFIQNGQLRLKSRSLQKEIVPKFSNAYNFSLSSIPVFRFLTDFQYYKKTSSLSLNLFPLETLFSYIPRIRVGNIILSRATWLISESEIKLLRENIDEKLNNWLSENRIPKQFRIIQGDNELLIDLDSEVSRLTFKFFIKKYSQLKICEFIPPLSTINNVKGETYANEFVALMKNDNSEKKNPIYQKTKPEVGRTFAPGSRWMYYKVYCNIKASDKLITQLLYPLAERLIEEGKIKRWFFIRYTDPRYHLRFRMELNSLEHYGEVAKLINSNIELFIQKKLVSEVLIGTYKRELERYLPDCIEQAETVFWHDSVAVCKIIRDTENEEQRWLAGMYAVDQMYDLFGCSIDQKISLTEEFVKRFYNEFGIGQFQRKNLNDKYRKLSKKITHFLNDSNVKEILHLNQRKSNILDETKFIQQKITTDTELDILFSYNHMTINRLFRSNQRANEMVIYHLLFKYYSSVRARQKQESLV